MDTIFGKLISDPLKVETHRALRDGIQHQHDISPLDPAPGEAVTVRVLTGGAPAIDSIELLYSADGSDPRAGGAALPFRRVDTEWDTLSWGYISRWQARIPPQADGTMVSYCIRGRGADSALIYADYPDAEARTQHATMLHFGNIPADTPFNPAPPGAAPLFCYHVDRLRPPAWVRDAIIYQIFIDRFYPGAGSDWRQPADVTAICGGTLWGVRDKLDYLAALGVNALWLSPTWASPSHHGYDVADYERVEPRLGGEAALRAVVEGAHKRGMRILLDLVANHLSNEHPIFLDACRSESSRYRDWFTFDDRYPHGYRSFFNVKTMPKINLEQPAARDWMIGNASKALRDFGVDGFRLDVAAGAGANFWTHCRPRLRAIQPDCFLVGEIIDTPRYLRSYRGRLDGCLDFSLAEGLRQTYAWENWDEARLEAFLSSHQRYFGEDFILPSFVDNHDMDRFSYISGGDSEALKRAAARQFRLPNPPIILYGTEVGARQPISTRAGGLDAGRVPMPWGAAQDASLLAFYTDLIQQRKARKGQSA